MLSQVIMFTRKLEKKRRRTRLVCRIHNDATIQSRSHCLLFDVCEVERSVANPFKPCEKSQSSTTSRKFSSLALQMNIASVTHTKWASKKVKDRVYFGTCCSKKRTICYLQVTNTFYPQTLYNSVDNSWENVNLLPLSASGLAAGVFTVTGSEICPYSFYLNDIIKCFLRKGKQN